MPIDPELAALMRDTVTIEVFGTTRTRAGEKSYGAPTSYTGRVSGKNTLVRDIKGEEKLSTVQVTLSSAPGVSVEDKITLPVRFVPRSPPIIAVQRASDENGAYFERVFCQ